MEDLFGNISNYNTNFVANHASKYASAPCIPYKGNKCKIAQQICNELPKCNHFLDACAGGGVIGYTMLASQKCNTVTLNDLYKPIITLHTSIIGKEIDFEKHKHCSRAQFHKSKADVLANNYTAIDVLNLICYSFGNHMSD